MATVTCGKCGTLLAAEGVTPPAQDAPCPACGHIGQDISVMLRGEEMKITAGVVGVTIVDYQHILLQDAAQHIAHQDFGVAIVVAHVACEITAQQAMTRAFARRSIPELERPVRELFTGFNFATDRIRDIYEAVSGDDIHNQPFWTEFTKSADPAKQIFAFRHAGDGTGSQGFFGGMHRVRGAPHPPHVVAVLLGHLAECTQTVSGRDSGRARTRFENQTREAVTNGRARHSER